MIEKERHQRERKREDLHSTPDIVDFAAGGRQKGIGTVTGEHGAFGKVQQHDSVCPELELVYEENG